jgi:integrase
MTLYRRGEEWWYHFGYHGAHIQGRTRTTNKHEARGVEAVHRAQLRTLNPTPTKERPNPLFEEFAISYLEYSKVTKASYGVEFYYITRTLVPYFGRMRLNQISALEGERYKQKRIRDGLKKSSINREIGLLKSMVSIAVEWELTSENGPKRTKLFKLDDPPCDRVLSYEEERKLLAACDESELRYRAPHLRTIILIALYTGLRRGEILRLRWLDVDFQKRVLTVQKSKTKSGTGRKVNLNSVLIDALLAMRKQEQGEWIFTSPKRYQTPGERERHIGDVKNAFRRAVHLAAIAPITFHHLRHTFCTRLSEAGVPLAVIQDLAGHASVTMTRRYTHPGNEGKQKAVELLVIGQQNAEPATKPAT